MSLGPLARRLLHLAACAVLPFIFVHLTYLLFRIPVWDVVISDLRMPTRRVVMPTRSVLGVMCFKGCGGRLQN